MIREAVYRAGVPATGLQPGDVILTVQVTTADLPTLMIGAIRQGYLADDPVPEQQHGGVAA